MKIKDKIRLSQEEYKQFCLLADELGLEPVEPKVDFNQLEKDINL